MGKKKTEVAVAVEAAIAVEKPAKAPKPPKAEKVPKHRVVHEGKTILCAGKDVTVRAMTPEEQKRHGVVETTGTFGAPLDGTELVLKFKSPKAAETFFEAELDAEDESIIDTGSKTEWYSESLNDMLMR